MIPTIAHFPYFDADRLFARPLIARPTSIAAHFQYSTSHLHIFAQSSARCSYPTAPTCLRRPTFQGVTFSALTFLHWLRLHRPCVLEVYIFTDLRFKEHVMNIPSNCTISHKLFKANFIFSLISVTFVFPIISPTSVTFVRVFSAIQLQERCTGLSIAVFGTTRPSLSIVASNFVHTSFPISLRISV